MPTTSELTQLIEDNLSNNQWRITTLFTSNKEIGNSKNINFSPLLSAHYFSQCVSNNRAMTVAHRLMDNLLKEHNSSQWNYHRHDPQYPNDLDDTIIAASVLCRTKQLPESEVITHIIKDLIAVEQEPGGPYRTWFVDKSDSSWGSDVDLVINYRVQSYLQRLSIKLPRLSKWLQAQATTVAHSSYYSEFESNLVRAAITNNWQWSSLIPSNPYEAALLLITSLNQHEQTYLSELYEYYRLLIEMPSKDLAAIPVFINRIRDGTTQWGGSTLLTYSACLAAITLFQQHLSSQSHTRTIKTIEKDVAHQIDTLLSNLPAQYKTKIKKQTTQLNNFSRSPALHYITKQLLIGALQERTNSKQLLEKLIAATILGWVAYTLHDTNIDSSSSPPHHFAAIASRTLILLTQNCFLSCCSSLPSQEMLRVSDWIKTVFIEMEQTYCVETTIDSNHNVHLDWDEYLYKRSAGLVITPVLLCKLNNSRLTLDQIISVYKPLIIARQILDDIHDLDDDLLHRRTTFVTCQIFCKEKDGNIVLTQNQRAAIQAYTSAKISNCLKQARQQVTRLPSSTHKIFMPEINRLQNIIDQQSTTIAVVKALTATHQEEENTQHSQPTKPSPPPHTTANQPTATECSSRVESRSTE
jgi:hypothetical protein